MIKCSWVGVVVIRRVCYKKFMFFGERLGESKFIVLYFGLKRNFVLNFGEV